MRVTPGAGLAIDRSDQVVGRALYQIIVHRSNISIDFAGEDEEIMDRVGLVHQCLICIIQLHVGTVVHAIGLEQVDLRFEIVELDGTDIG